MADRYPLIANSQTKRIEELAAGDNLNLQNSSIVGATTITAQKFVGDLQGTADFSNTLTDGSNILTGTISSQRLSGYYPIQVEFANSVDADGILNGTIPRDVLSGTYDIDITGTAQTANFLENAANINGGIINVGILSGTYNINITGNANRANTLSPGIYDVSITGSARTAFDVIGGIASVTSLDVSGISTVNQLNATDIDATNTVTALKYFGSGVTLSGIVTQITNGKGINISSSQPNGKGVVNIDSYFPIGKTIFVTQNGDDNNSGLTVDDAKRTIKAASNIAIFGDTIKVYPGVYVEENPIILKKTVSVEGTELRNCVVTPKYSYLDLFHVNNGCHITDMSFIGPDMTDGAAVIALQTLEGVAVDRYFDAARMIRFNLDYIANEAVGFLTSTQYIGAGRTQVTDPVFQVVNSSGVSTNPINCSDDIKSILKCIIHDITRGGNSKCVEAGKSYYDDNYNLLHITGTDPNGYSVKEATIDTIKYAVDIARAIVNNVTWGGNPVGLGTTVVNASYDQFTGITTITANNHGLVKDDAVKIVGLGFTCPSGPGIVTYPTGAFGYIFNVQKVINNNSFEVVVGQSTLPHTYVSGGKIQKYTNFTHNSYQVKDLAIQKDPLTGFNNAVNGCANVVSAIYSCVGIVTNIIGLGSTAFSSVGIRTSYPGNSGIGFTSTLNISSVVYDEVSGKTTILAPGLQVKRGETVELRDLRFSCSSGGGVSTQVFPSGKYGYDFTVDKINNNGSFDVYVGPSTLPHTYSGGGIAVNRTVAVTTATYNHITGITTIRANGLSIETGDLVTIRNLEFSCLSGSGTTTIYPTGKNGYEFRVLDIVTDKPVAITTAIYDHTTGITTITAPGIGVTYNGLVELRGLKFSCPPGSGITTDLYPTGNNGYEFRVLSSIGSTFTVNVGPSTISHTYVSGGVAINRTNTANDTFTINVGPSTIPHNYVSGGIVIPPFSRGVGPITQGPYIRNCTNFIGKSIGMKVDGFAAEPGDKDDIGVTGTMSVDSYTQYNQGGIGVSITSGAYAQLVSIFTICDDIGIYTESGGQCDITNSNCSFGNYGLYSKGVGDSTTKSIYRYTGIANTVANAEQSIIEVSGVGNLRPYDGQAIYFGELYYQIRNIKIIDGGSGYTQPPIVTIDSPTGPNGIRAEAISNIDSSGKVISINIISSGSQYRIGDRPKITLSSPNSGTTATAELEFSPIYYTIESATLPSAGISTIILNNNLNNTVSAGTTVYFTRLSLQIATSISLEWVGAGTNINTAKPALGGVTIQENEVFKDAGGQVVYTSTNQSGNFQIGDDVVINQLTGTISGRAFNQSLLNTVTPLIIALSN